MKQRTITETIVDAVVGEMHRERKIELNIRPEITRESLAAQHGRVWDTAELSADFEVRGRFMATYILVRRRSDGQTGRMEFTHVPRFYFNFVAG
jgi:hypothetical protein